MQLVICGLVGRQVTYELTHDRLTPNTHTYVDIIPLIPPPSLPTNTNKHTYQAAFVRAHDPVRATRRDDLTSTDTQEVKVWLLYILVCGVVGCGWVVWMYTHISSINPPTHARACAPKNKPTRRHEPTTIKSNGQQVLAPVLQMDVWLDPSYVCALYESCKGTNAVAQVNRRVYVCMCLSWIIILCVYICTETHPIYIYIYYTIHHHSCVYYTLTPTSLPQPITTTIR